MADNSPQGGTDTIRDLARQAGAVKTQVMQLDLGGATDNAEVLITAGQQTMAVSVPVVIASNQTTLPATLAAETTKVIGTVRLADAANLATIKAASTAAVAADPALVVALSPSSLLPGQAPTTTFVSVTAATGTAATATLAAPAAGLFHYITSIEIELYATAARTGGATPVAVTTTNITGTPSWNFPTAQAIGVIDRFSVPIVTPIKSAVAATATTIVAPIATTGIWRINVSYYTAA